MYKTPITETKENMAAEQLCRNTDQFEKEDIAKETTSTKNFQDEVRQWFTAMSPEGRAAVLGFEDLFIADLMSRGPSSSPPSSTAPQGDKNNSDNNRNEQPSKQVNISIQQPSPTSLLPPKRTTGELSSNGT